jgi:hypothetical protein
MKETIVVLLPMKPLPNELLLDIFDHLRCSSLDIVNVMLCCRTWHQLAEPILYKHITLKSTLHHDSRCSRFARTFLTEVPRHHLVHSITLSLTSSHLSGFSTSRTEAYERMWEICDILMLLPNLQIFSLRLERLVGYGHPGPGIASFHILRHLPNSLIDLNLNCGGLDTPNILEAHIIHAIGRLVPKLKSLKFKL